MPEQGAGRARFREVTISYEITPDLEPRVDVLDDLIHDAVMAALGCRCTNNSPIDMPCAIGFDVIVSATTKDYADA